MTQVAAAPALYGRRYQTGKMLGQGGMGTVYETVDRLTGNTIALKRVTGLTENQNFNSPNDSLNFRLALAREFKVLASLRHPNIINVLDYGFDEQRQPYITMEYLENATNFVDAARSKTPDEQINLLIDLLQALAYLHRRGILHHDLKPSNVLVTSDGVVKVLDFGLAIEPEKAEGDVVGTLAYMAPEIIQGREPTTAIDLYAVGVMAYEIFSGKHPFDINNAQKLLQDVLFSDPDLTTIFSNTSQFPARPATDTQVLSDEFKTLQLDNLQTNVINNFDTAVVDTDLALITQPTLPQDVIQFDFTDTDDVTTLAGIVGKLLAKQPENRYSNSDRVIADLAAAVGISVPQESAAIRESFLQAATFVGREAELKQLEQALAEATTGKGGAWLIAGESGVGKSRLIEELRIRALVQGITVLRGEAVEDGGLPYQLWREPLRRLVLTSTISDLDASILRIIIPDIDDLLGRSVVEPVALDSEAHQRRLMGAIANLFQNQTQPIMLILEDLQWSTESLEVVKLLYGMMNDMRLLMVGNYRHEERPDLPGQLPGMQVMRLERLAPAEIAALSVSMLGESGRQSDVLQLLNRETEGNVFFLVEVVRVLAEEAGGLGRVGSMSLPANVLAGGIRTIIRRRLEHIPENGQALLRLAAISGRQMDLKLLEQLKGDVDLTEWLTTCVNSAVFDVQDGQYRFAHDKLREVTIADLSADTAAGLHRQLALGLEQVYPNTPEQAAIIAQHWRAAGDLANEFQYTQAAADYALRISALSEAINHFERCQELLPSVIPDTNERRFVKAELYVKLGEALQYTGAYSEAAVEIAEGLALYEIIGDQAGAARALSLQGDNYWRTGNYEAALKACSESFALYRVLHYPDGEARTLNRLGMVALEQGDYVRANEQIQAALKVAEASQNPVARATSLNNLGLVALRQGNYADSVRYFEETLALHRENGERWKVASTLHNLGTLSGVQGDLNGAIRNFEEALQMCRTIGDRRGISLALENLGFVALLRSEYEKATTYLEESLSLAQAIGNRPGAANVLINLGHAASAQQHTTRAADFFSQALQIAHELDAAPMMLESVCGLAGLQPDDAQTLAWFGMVLKHPAASQETRDMATKALNTLKETRPAEAVDAAVSQGYDLRLEQVVQEILR